MSIRLELQEQSVNIIIEALSNAPYRAVAQVINEIAVQLQTQQVQPPGPGIPVATVVPGAIPGNGGLPPRAGP